MTIIGSLSYSSNAISKIIAGIIVDKVNPKNMIVNVLIV